MTLAITEKADGVAVITLNRPEALNAFTEALYDATTEALIAALTARFANTSRNRIERMEELRRSYAITEDAFAGTD